MDHDQVSLIGRITRGEGIHRIAPWSVYTQLGRFDSSLPARRAIASYVGKHLRIPNRSVSIDWRFARPEDDDVLLHAEAVPLNDVPRGIFDPERDSEDLAQRVLLGGYLEMQGLRASERRVARYGSWTGPQQSLADERVRGLVIVPTRFTL